MAKIWTWLAETIGLKGLLIIVVTAILSVALAYNYYRVHQAFKTVKAQTSTIKVLEWDLKKTNEKLESFQGQHGQVKADMEKQFEQFRKQLSEKQSAIDELNREARGKKSVDELAKAKPKLVQKILTKGTDKVLSCLEVASGNSEAKCDTSR